MPKSSQHKEDLLVLEEPQWGKWQVMQNQLNSCYNKQQLQSFAEAFTPWLNNYSHIKRLNANGNAEDALVIEAMLKNTASKYIITEGVTLILANEKNLQSYIDTLSNSLQQLWHEVLLNNYVSHSRAKEILGTKSNLFKTSYSYYYYSDRLEWSKKEYAWFTTSHMRSAKKLDYGYREYEDFITVSNVIRSIFFPMFFPELKQGFRTIEKLPKGLWRTIDLEAESLSAFNLFSGLFKQGELPLKKKGITAADMKRANKKMVLTEFFPDDHNEYRVYLRAFNYLGVLSLNEHLKSNYKAKKVLSYADTLLDMVKNFEKLEHYLPQLLYPHIKGMRQNQTQWGHHGDLCKYMMEHLKTSKSDGWTAISDIFTRVVQLDCNGKTTIHTALVYNPHEEQNTTVMINLNTLETITGDKYTREFGITGLKSFAFMLASLGIAEIAINITAKTDVSPFDSLEYIRLTPLGRYALGMEKEYKPPVIEQEAYFELDPERLIIRSLKDPNPYEQLLRDTAMPISRGRFQTSALSFLTNCHSREDVEGKIQIFRQFIASELPTLWEQFFQTLLQHCHPLKEDKTSYKHYTLQPDNRDLIQLITSDSVLRETVIRAEGYRILVKTEDIRKFETQLKKHGYLL